MNLVILFLVYSLNGWSNCLNFAGIYEWENPDSRDSQTIQLTVRQQGCEHIVAEYDYGQGSVFPRNFFIDGQRHLIFDMENAKLFETHLWQNGKLFIKSELEVLQDDNSWATEVVHAYIFLDSPNVLTEEAFSYDENGRVDSRTKSNYLRK